MNEDIRLPVGFFDHWKVKAFKKTLGPDGVLSLVRLWTYAAVNRHDGNLTGMKPAEIEAAADWSGKPGELFKELVKGRWLDKKSDRSLKLHEWYQHQPYAAHAQDRSDKARKAAEARWNSDARSMPGASGEHAGSNAQFESSNAPSPSPSPSPFPSPKPKHTQNGATAPSAADAAGVCVGESSGTTTAAKVESVFRFWSWVTERYDAPLTPDRVKLIEERLDEYSPLTLASAIVGCILTPFNLGENNRGRSFVGLETIFKSAGRVEDYAAAAEERHQSIQKWLGRFASGENAPRKYPNEAVILGYEPVEPQVKTHKPHRNSKCLWCKGMSRPFNSDDCDPCDRWAEIHQAEHEDGKGGPCRVPCRACGDFRGCEVCTHASEACKNCHDELRRRHAVPIKADLENGVVNTIATN
jgi:hypothetical protein